MSSERLTERILKFVASTEYRPQQVSGLARALGVAEDEYGDFHQAVKALMKSGRVVMGAGHALMLPEPGGKIFGKFRANPRGFGFVIPDSPQAHGDLYIPEGHAQGALTGDAVCAAVLKRGKRRGKMLYEGRILQIISRSDSRFVGELQRGLGHWFVRPDGNTFHAPIFIGDVGAKRATAGDQVVVEMTEYPAPGRDARGVIVEVLGQRGAPGVDLLSIIRQYGFRTEFPEDVLAEARRVTIDYNPDAALAGRDDLRDLTVITIDPETARDFDDAISIRPCAGGRVELGVHIADVAYFVCPGGALDKEARERSNSVYFPSYVVPMLPEVLSNGLCSLQEGQPRLAKSAFITYDRKGKVVSARFSNSLIQSSRRLTYQEATVILEGRSEGYDEEVVALLKEMERLAKAIQARRMRDGMLVLNLPEVEVVLNDTGEVVGVQPEDTGFSHTIIEMFMVEANEAVARLLAGLGVPNLRRIHPEPDERAVEALGRFLNALGLKAPKSADRRTLQKLLAEVEGKPVQFAAHLAVLRSMAQAVYSPKPVGHFALASEDYLHFTSPIRRYPDLTIHRLLDAYLLGELGRRRGRREWPTVAALQALGDLCSTHERRAENAERQLKLVYLLRLLQHRLGESFDGIVTGVTHFGVFVQLPDYLVEGLLRYSDLPEDWWEVDVDSGRVVGERTGQRMTIGDRLKVTVAAVDLGTRQLDLAPAGPLGGARQRAPATAAAGASAPRRRRKSTERASQRRTAGRKGRRSR
ncbi:MAG: ribonuclease R [Planctomycetota bacterium]